MTTSVTITGTGTPLAAPGLAGPGVLVRSGATAIQIDTGRATTMRLVEAGIDLTELTAVCITHHHSDHVVGLPDLLMTRWLEHDAGAVLEPLPVVVPRGPAVHIVEHMLDVWSDEIALRRAHTGRVNQPRHDTIVFDATDLLKPVYRDRDVSVLSMLVAHDPVIPAVGYRIETPDGVVAVSGDTRVCENLEQLASGADVFVCEAFRGGGDVSFLSDPDAIAAYHADARDVGGLAKRARVGTLVLTHLIPPIRSPNDRDRFEEEIRTGGYKGVTIVASDLDEVVI